MLFRSGMGGDDCQEACPVDAIVEVSGDWARAGGMGGDDCHEACPVDAIVEVSTDWAPGLRHGSGRGGDCTGVATGGGRGVGN